MYESWVVDELGSPLFPARELTDNELDVYFDMHPEHYIRYVYECDDVCW